MPSRLKNRLRDSLVSAEDKPVYSENDFAKMAKAVQMEELPQNIRDRIVEAAQAYEWAAAADTFSSRADRPKLMKRIRRRAEKLEASLRRLDQETGSLLDANILPDDLGVLQVKAQEALKKIPKSSHEPYRARRSFVADLAGIYKEATGDEPTRRDDPKKGGLYGPFQDFVLAALRPIAPHETSGVDGDIRAVIRKRKKSNS